MIRLGGIVMALALVFMWIPTAGARPEFLARFQSDPMRRAEVDGCGTCHINPQGAGPRNDFGNAFQDAGQVITPMIRVNFPDRFDVPSAKLADGSTMYFADPTSASVVFERNNEKILIDLEALTADTEEERLPPPENRMTFFVTSVGLGNGGHLAGLAGADRHCQELAEAVGAGDLEWRAYLSTSFGDKPAINAGDRIGSGPWYNAKGELIAHGVADLHKNNRLSKETALNEKGEVVFGRGDSPNRHDILTGTLPDGTAAVGLNCNNWTSAGDEKAIVGHHDRQGNGDTGSSWNSAHETAGCSQEAFQQTGGDGLFYCFAIRP